VVTNRKAYHNYLIQDSVEAGIVLTGTEIKSIRAGRYQRKAKWQDREDLNPTIILSLAQAQLRLDNDGGGQLSDFAMLRIASCRVADYWRSEYRNGRMVSLNQVVYQDEDGNEVELIDTLAYDEATDFPLDNYLSARS
ncbi:unnamed protein product, partial [marine sediment metagenome]